MLAISVTALIISPVRSFQYVTVCGGKKGGKGKTNVILAISVTALVISLVRSLQKCDNMWKKQVKKKNKCDT